MHPQVVQAEERLLGCALDGAAQNLDEHGGVDGAVEDLPAPLLEIGDGGNDRKTMTIVGHVRHECLPLGGGPQPGTLSPRSRCCHGPGGFQRLRPWHACSLNKYSIEHEVM